MLLREGWGIGLPGKVGSGSVAWVLRVVEKAARGRRAVDDWMRGNSRDGRGRRSEIASVGL